MFNKFRAKRQYKTDTETFKYDPEIAPIKLRVSFNKLYDGLLSYLKTNEYENIFEYEKYNELFGTKGEFELTFSISEKELEGVCILNILLYNEFRKGVTYKAIKPIINDIKEQFAFAIVE